MHDSYSQERNVVQMLRMKTRKKLMHNIQVNFLKYKLDSSSKYLLISSVLNMVAIMAGRTGGAGNKMIHMKWLGWLHGLGQRGLPFFLCYKSFGVMEMPDQLCGQCLSLSFWAPVFNDVSLSAPKTNLCENKFLSPCQKQNWSNPMYLLFK